MTRELAYRLAMWLLRLSGNAGAAAWTDLRDRVSLAERNYYQADHERWGAVKGLQHFRRSVEIADSLLSSDQPTKAQEMLRVALIASRDVLRSQPPRQAATE